jgi:hypothetical protein
MRGPYKNRQSEYDGAIELRRIGYGYGRIASEINVPWRIVCAWVKHIPVDKRVAHEEVPARKKLEGFPVGKSAVRLRLIKNVATLARSVGWTDGLAGR